MTILSPLSAVMEEQRARHALLAFARESHEALQSERIVSLEAQVLTVIRLPSETAAEVGVPVKRIATIFSRSFGKEYPRPVTARWIGGIVRQRLNLKTYKSHGIFVVVGPAEQAKLKLLYERYGVTDEDVEVLADEPGVLTGDLRVERSQVGDGGDVGDVPGLPVIR
jgi:hypothetical protein